MNVSTKMTDTVKVNRLRKIRKWFLSLYTAFVFMLLGAQTAFAETVGDSKIAKGTEKLIQDATAWLMIIAPVVTVLAIIYFLIRKGMSEELDHKKWNTRIIVALVSCIGAVLAAVIVNLLVSYYQ